jgi:hypothetical protein
MSRAALHFGIIEMAKCRDRVVASIGSRPPWWRPFARRAWDRETAAKREWIARADIWIREAFNL